MRSNTLRKLIYTLLLALAGKATIWGQTTRVDAANLVRPAGSAGNIQYNNTSGIGGSPNLHWDNSNSVLRIGQPLSGAARIVVKGSNTLNTAYVFQGYDSGETERSRITNGGYFQGAGIGRPDFDYSAVFKLDARLQQPASVVSTLTGGASSLVSFNGTFAPTSGTGEMNLVEVVGTVNQTGGANGKVRMMYLAANAVSAPNLYALETVGGYSLIGDGAVFPEIMPRLAVVGLGNTSATNAFGVFNTFGTPLLDVGDDGQVGIGNTTPAYSLDITGSDAIRLPKGTTAQRPTTNPGILRFNLTDNKFEGYDGSAWVQFASGSGASAPVDATYLTFTSNATLTQERAITAGANLKLTDGGANSYMLIDALSEKFVTGGVISPAQLTANQNDWSPTGLSTASVVRISTDATFRTLTGLDGGETGRRITLLNVGAYTLMLEDESAASTAGNRFAFDSQDWFILPGKALELMYDATSSRWRTLTPFDYNNDYVLAAQFRHGVAGATGSGTNGDYFVKANSSGGSSGLAGTPWGQTGITTGTLATGKGSIGAPANAMVRTYPSIYLRFAATVTVDVLSDAGNTYKLRCGWMDTANPTGEPSNGVYFRYTHGTNSGNWQLVARNGGTESVINTSTAPLTGNMAQQTLIVSIAPNGTAVEGYIGGVSVGEITTNIPASTNMGYYAQIEKTVGTTTRNLYLGGANVLVVGNKRQ